MNSVTNRGVAKFDSTELITLCASMLSDAEISSEDAYNLAEWLNNHPEAGSSWPGSELIKPLQKIWADGTVNQRELHRLARLLISIQREWARHPQTDIRPITSDPIATFPASTIDDVRLPSLTGKFRVPSQSVSGRFYEVDLNGPSCTCQDWRTWRCGLPLGDLTRCCKHVLHVYATLARRRQTDDWLLAFIDNGWPANPGAEWHLMTIGAGKVLFCTASENGWANVFAKDGSLYARFGYNVKEDRWAYGVHPAAANAIARAIASFRNKPNRQGPRQDILPPVNQAPQPRSRVTTLSISAAIVAIIGISVAIERWPAPRGRAGGQAIVTRSTEMPAVQLPTATPLFPTTAPVTASVTQPMTNSLPARVRTNRAIRAKSGRHEIVIPNDTQLRVVGWTESDLIVSYKGWTVTIPASAASLTTQ